MRIFIILIFMWGTLLSCSHKSTKVDANIDKIEKILIKPDKTNSPHLASEVFRSVKYIPIETSDSFMMGKIDNLQIINRCFVLVDKSVTHSIFITDSVGKRKGLINKLGGGPGEYTSLTDVSLNFKDNEISIWCDMLKKSMNYDLDGYYKNENKIDVYASLMQKTSEDTYAFYSLYSSNTEMIEDQMYPNIFLTKQDKSIIVSADYFPSKYMKKNLISYKRSFSRPFKDTVSILPDYSNIIYYISKGSIIPRYYIDFGNHTINIDDFWLKMADPSYTKDDIVAYYEKKYCVVVNFKESNKYIYLAYKQKDSFQSLLFSKKTKKTIYLNYIINDLNIHGTATNPIFMENNKLYGTVAPELLIELAHKDSRYSQYLQLVNESDNPIIVELTLNDF